MPRSKNLRLRLTAGALLPLIAAVAAQAAYTLVSQRDAMDRGLENKARALAGLMVNVAGPNIAFDDDKAVGDGLAYVAGDADFGFAAAIAASDGRVIAFRGDHLERAEVAGIMTATANPVVRHQGSLLVAAAPVVTDGHQVGTVFVGLRSDAVRAQVTHMAEWAAAISVVGIAIAVAVVLVLAGKIARRNAQMRVVLDNVEEALVTVHPDGLLDPECSAAFVRWFGEPGREHFAGQIAGSDERMAAMLRLGWSEIVEGLMPIELLVDQFPNKLERDGRHYRIDIKPLFSDEVLTGALLRIRDVTAEVETQRVLSAQREYVAVFERALADPHGVSEFIEDTSKLVDRLPASDLDPVDRKRAAHTIKGNAAIYGISSVADIAHRLEDTMTESNEVDPEMVKELVTAWASFATRIEHLMGDGRRNNVDVSRSDIEALADLAERGGQAAAERLRALLLEPVAVRFDGFRRQMGRVAERLGKPAPEVVIDAVGARLPLERLRPFWSAFSHLVRNALDHGVEPADQRTAAGKPEAGRIELRARVEEAVATIEIADDGRGIDWDRLRSKARAAGLPAESHGELVAALFADGVSTANAVTETSGRGVGLSAVLAAAREVGGQVDVESEPGKGTRFRFTFVIPSLAPRARRGTRQSLPPPVSAILPVFKGTP